ncbi:hypothetical protein LOC68_02475 [Blastopirellula sp. JC732]|uniref:Uncharacterized protein n=1 Tax=Blastopirellula sediminis TaxID=2894196 RepID=A0A9X1MI90_9BACT|nr:hypothetical protein [Blastopirellula sediminis]MCC9607946.1 hypothetical protein [Blastopirellula sediminis]MCC9627261.1 hypothetical protein [Blastopirellula sediminis]
METYIRFQTDIRGPGCGRRRGIFISAGHVEDNFDLTPAERSALCESLGWFNENLPVPPSDEFSQQAIFWFRASSQQMMARIWELVWILSDQGAHVRRIRTKRPGEIEYSDEHQVAAIPHGVRRFRRGGKRVRRQKIYGR